MRHIQRDPDETTRLGNVRASHTQLDKENLREKLGGLIVYVFLGGAKGVVYPHACIFEYTSRFSQKFSWRVKSNPSLAVPFFLSCT